MRLPVAVGCICFFVLSHSAIAEDARAKLVGVWKLDKFVIENVDTKERRPVYGEHPKGVLVMTPERLTLVLTGEGRKAPQTDEDRVASFRSMFAYSGPYTVEGDRLAIKVEIAWNEAWTGTDQVRFVKLEGDKLFVETAPAPPVNQPPGTVGSMTKGILEWSRSK